MIHRDTTSHLASAGCSTGRLSLPAFLARRVLCFVIQLYRLTLSPALVFLFGPQTGCRFTPTCSQYAIEAIQEHGSFTGGILAVKRICRCHPYGACGHDPVPPALSKVEGRTC
jgi:putative membrane protein insertion efficiency factor